MEGPRGAPKSGPAGRRDLAEGTGGRDNEPALGVRLCELFAARKGSAVPGTEWMVPFCLGPQAAFREMCEGPSPAHLGLLSPPLYLFLRTLTFKLFLTHISVPFSGRKTNVTPAGFIYCGFIFPPNLKEIKMKIFS